MDLIEKDTGSSRALADERATATVGGRPADALAELFGPPSGRVDAGGYSPSPALVRWVHLSIFVSFNVCAVNLALQDRRVGRWHDYLYGERAYVVLSLVAKSLLAWQVFAGTLRPA